MNRVRLLIVIYLNRSPPLASGSLYKEKERAYQVKRSRNQSANLPENNVSQAIKFGIVG